MQAIEPAKNHDRYWVPGLARGLDVLKTIGAAQHALSLAEIAKRLDLSRSSVFRLVYTLEQLGYLEQAPGSRGYDLSPGVLDLGYSYLAGRDLTSSARPVLEELAKRVGISAHLAILSGTDVVYLIHAPGGSGFVSTISAGDRLPAYATPMGQAILAYRDPAEVDRLLADKGLVPMTEQTPTSIDQLRRLLEAVRGQGFAVSRGAVHSGGQSIAVPVFGRDGSVACAIGLSGPDSAFTGDDLEGKMFPQLLEASRGIASRLGG